MKKIVSLLVLCFNCVAMQAREGQLWFDFTSLNQDSVLLYYIWKNNDECELTRAAQSLYGQLTGKPYEGTLRISETVLFGGPKAVTGISSGSFFQCYSLTAVEIPKSVTNVYAKAFVYCRKSLTYVKIYAETPPEVSENDLGLCNECNATLLVPTGCKQVYESHEAWGKFIEIVEFDPASEEAATIGELSQQSPVVRLCHGVLSVSGVDDLQQISVYSLDGKCLGVVPVVDGAASLTTSLQTVIVRLGSQSIIVR